jgi:predicted acyltransferase
MTNTNGKERDAGIDSLRALTMFTMIFVNDFWKVHDVPHWLEHATRGEDFMGLSDVVYPCFLFVVGMSIPFAIEQRYRKGMSDVSTVGHILSRTFALLIMGAFITNSESRLSPDVSYKIGVYWFLMVAAFICIWNQYPRTDNPNRKRVYALLKIAGVLMLLFLAITFRDPKGEVFAARWGILGSIGWTYLLCAMIYVFTRDRLKYLIPIWIAFIIICMLGSRMNEAHGGEALLSLPRPNFYNELLGILHIGSGTLPAFTTGGIILSILSARYVQTGTKKKIIFVTATVLVLLLAGYISRQFWILSKLSATPTWIFYVTAIATVFYALFYGLSKNGENAWLNIIKPAGTATLTCYLIPYVAYGFADLTGIILPDWFTHGPMGIVNCLCFAFVIIGATWLLGRLHIKLKI